MALPRKLGKLPRLGERIDRYGVVAEIAHGGMAAVYAVTRADTPGFDKLLAMKVMLPHLAGDQRFVAMFTDEARIAARINHPNVAQVFDVGQTPFPHLVLEYIHGQSLSALLRRAWLNGAPRLSRGLICRILSEVASGLDAAHRAKSVDGEPLGIVHRDVSPQNVLIGYDGQVKVVDFGVAAARGRIASTRTGEVKGKIAFLAPEQLTRRPVDLRTDLWSFGVMAWQVFARRSLFKGASESETMWNVVNRAVPDLEDVDPSLPSELAEVVHACLCREMHDRPSSAAAVAATFAAAADEESATAREAATDRAALAALVSEVFAEERAAEDARLAKAVRDHDGGFLTEGERDTGTTNAVSIPHQVAGKRNSWRTPLAVVGSLAAVVAATVLWPDSELPEATVAASAPGVA